MMHAMFQAGFLGTKAPFFMDIVTLVVAFLPLLVYGAVFLARKKMFFLHMLAQNTIFLVSFIIVAYFELGVRVGGGFDGFMQASDVSYTYALVVLIVHIIIATLTFLYWVRTILSANYQYFKKLLPGRASYSHRLSAIKTFLGIVFTSFSGIWVYLLLFVY